MDGDNFVYFAMTCGALRLVVSLPYFHIVWCMDKYRANTIELIVYLWCEAGCYVAAGLVSDSTTVRGAVLGSSARVFA